MRQISTFKSEAKQLLIPESEQKALLFYALQHALGRHAHIVRDVVRAIIHAWPELSTKERYDIHGEILLGMDTGRAGLSVEIDLWKKVLELEV